MSLENILQSILSNRDSGWAQLEEEERQRKLAKAKKKAEKAQETKKVEQTQTVKPGISVSHKELRKLRQEALRTGDPKLAGKVLNMERAAKAGQVGKAQVLAEDVGKKYEQSSQKDIRGKQSVQTPYNISSPFPQFPGQKVIQPPLAAQQSSGSLLGTLRGILEPQYANVSKEEIEKEERRKSELLASDPNQYLREGFSKESFKAGAKELGRVAGGLATLAGNVTARNPLQPSGTQNVLQKIGGVLTQKTEPKTAFEANVMKQGEALSWITPAGMENVTTKIPKIAALVSKTDDADRIKKAISTLGIASDKIDNVADMLVHVDDAKQAQSVLQRAMKTTAFKPLTQEAGKITPEIISKSQEIHQQALAHQPKFEKQVETIAKKHGFDYEHGLVKSPERIGKKVAKEYNNDFSKLGDANRSYFTTETPTPEKIDALAKDVGRLRNNNLYDKSSGYKKAIINIKTPYGEGEIQVTIPEMLKVKNWEERNFPEGKRNNFSEKVAEVQKRYEEAGVVLERRLKSSSEISPSLRKSAFMTGKESPAESVAQPSSFLGSKSTRTKVSPTSKNFGNLPVSIKLNKEVIPPNTKLAEKSFKVKKATEGVSGLPKSQSQSATSSGLPLSEAQQGVPARTAPVQPEAFVPGSKSRSLQRQSTTNLIKSQGEKISDVDIRKFREQNLLGPETVDDIILRKRGIITDKEAVDRAKKYKMTLDNIINTPPGTVPNKEKLTAMSQVVQQEREVNQALRRLAEGKGVASSPAERQMIKELGGKYQNLSEEQLIGAALQENTLKLKKAEIALMAAKSEAGRSLQGAKQAIDAVDSRMRIVYDSMRKRTPLEQEAILQRIAKEPIEDPKNFLKLLEDLNDADFFDKFAEFSVAAKLWNPTTHVVNFGSNVVRQVADVVITDVTNPTLAKADALGAYTGLKQGLKSALRALTDEGYASQLSKYVETGGKMSAIKGKTGKIVRIPFRMLGAGDEIFKGITYQRSLYRQAAKVAQGDKVKMKKLLEAPTFKMMQEATEQAKRMTYQEDMGEIVSKINKFRDPAQYTSKAGKTMGVISRMYLSFLKTPVNLFKQAADFSPIGFIKNKGLIVEGFKKGGVAKEEAMRRIGEATLGTGLALWGISEAMDGKVTGAAPRDKKEKELFYKEGKLPYAIKIGDKWVQYQRVEPYSTVLAATADFYNLAKEDTLALGTVVNKIVNQLSDKTYLQGVSDLINLFTGEEWEQRKAVQGGILGSVVPSIVGHLARSTDKVIRETQTFKEKAQALVPALSKKLPAQHDIFGGVKERSREPWWSYFMNPIRTSEQSKDPIIQEMRRLQDAGYGVVPTLQGNDMGGVKLSGKNKQDFQKLYGEKTRKAYEEIMNDSIYKGLGDVDKQDILDSAVRYEREWAKQELFGTGQIPKQSWRDKLNKMGLVKEEGLEMDMLEKSDKFIKFKNTAEDLKKNLTAGNMKDFYDKLDSLSKEDQATFGDIKAAYPEFKGLSPYNHYDNPTSQKAENTRTFNERLMSDHPEEGIRFLDKLDPEEKKRILNNLDNKGNEEKFKKYQETLKTKSFKAIAKPKEEIQFDRKPIDYMAENIDVPDKYKQDVANAAEENGVPQEILANMLKKESSFNEAVISGTKKSTSGALGIAQFMPETAKSLGIDPLDPKQAVPAAAKYLKQMYDKFGTWEKALAAYNAGEGNVRKYNGVPPFPETREYIDKIMGARYEQATSLLEKKLAGETLTSAEESLITKAKKTKPADLGITVPVESGTKIDIPGTARDEGQCGAFVNDYLGKRLFADSYQQKKSLINSDEPETGAIAVIPTKAKYGHVAIVESVNNDGTVNVVEANWKGDRTVGRRKVSEKDIDGYYVPTESPKTEFAGRTMSNAIYITPAGKRMVKWEEAEKEKEREKDFEKAFDKSYTDDYEDEEELLIEKRFGGELNYAEFMAKIRRLRRKYKKPLETARKAGLQYYGKWESKEI